VDVAFAENRDLLILDSELRKIERIRLSASEPVVETEFPYPIRVSLLPPDLPGTVVAVRGPVAEATRLVLVSEANRSVSVRERAGGAFTDFFGHQFRAMSVAEGAETQGFSSAFRDPPSDVAFNDTLIVVAQPRQDAFAVFDLRDGTSLGAYGAGYEDDRRLDEPRGVALFPDGNIAVADHRNDRVAVFSADLASLVVSFPFPQVQGVAVSRSGELYAWDEDGSRIAQLPPQGAPIQLGTALVPGPVRDVAFDAAGNLFLLEAETSRVTVINAAKDRIYVRFGGRDPEFEATHISVDDVGNVYLGSPERENTHTYRWDLNLPPLSDLRVTLTGQGADLTWSPIESEFLAGYRISGAASPGGPFTTLLSTGDASASVAAGPDDEVRWIQVTPMTVAGMPATGPDPVPLYHLNALAASDGGEYGLVIGVMERLDEVLAEGILQVETSLWQELQWRALEAEAELGYFEAAAAREAELGDWTGDDGGFTLHRRLAEVHQELGNDADVLEHATTALDLIPDGDATTEVGLDLLRMAVGAAFATGAYPRVLSLGETLRPHATADEEFELVALMATSRLEVDQPAMALRMADELMEREAAGELVSYGADRANLAWTAFQSAVRLGDEEAVTRWRPQVEPTVQGARQQQFQILVGAFQLQQGETEAALETLLSLTTPGDPDVVGDPAVVELSFGVYRALQDADSAAHQAGLDFLGSYAEQLPEALGELRAAYGDSIAVFTVLENTKVTLGGAFQAWRDADLFGLVGFLEDVLAQGSLTVDEEILARALLAGAYMDTGRSEDARGELVRILGFEPAYDASAANDEAAALYGVTPFNEALTELLEQVRNQGNGGP
jgi:hypothetical protein